MSFDEEVKAATAKQNRSHPKGWEPGIIWDGKKGAVTTVSANVPTDGLWQSIIADWGLDPTTTQVVDGSVQIRAWDAPGGERLRYYRATIRSLQETDESAQIDIDKLCKRIEKRKPVKPIQTDSGRALVALLSDWQLGKGDEPNGGTEQTVERICEVLDALPERLKSAKRAGHEFEAVYLVGLGDIVEQCSGHYPSQQFKVDLDRRQQMRLARRLILRAVDNVAPYVGRVVLAAVPGNHGENRQNGKAFTRSTDNDDLAVFEQVAEIMSFNPDAYGHVTTVLADGNTLTLDIAGVPVAFAHGHKAGQSGHPAAKLEKWWSGQVMGKQPVGDAAILITGHYHHLIVSETTGRTFIQVPALDGGSEWWTDISGQASPAGFLTLGIGVAYGGRAWGDLHVHTLDY